MSLSSFSMTSLEKGLRRILEGIDNVIEEKRKINYAAATGDKKEEICISIS